jgi:RNase P subunit RPR2
MNIEENSGVVSCSDCMARMRVTIGDTGDDLIVPCDECESEIRVFFGKRPSPL